jgi:hypothetical protein
MCHLNATIAKVWLELRSEETHTMTTETSAPINETALGRTLAGKYLIAGAGAVKTSVHPRL